MKRLSDAFGWALFFLLGGIFLLLNNLGVFGEWGPLIWGALYALAGLGFLVWFIVGRQHWWRAIPAFTLLSIGAVIILGWRGINLGAWRAPFMLFGMALGFWVVLLLRQEHWWALFPAGVLTVVGVLFGLWGPLGEAARLPVLFIGIGLVFLLLYAIRFDERDARWAAVPAAALLLLGVVTLAEALNLQGILANWWPLLLVVLGGGLAALAIVRRNTTVALDAPLAPAPAIAEETPAPAPGAEVSALPTVEELAAANPMPWEAPQEAKPPAKGEPDIYDLIKKQPKD